MKILALDMATRTGWAHSDGASGVWKLDIRRDESNGTRLLDFEAQVRQVLAGPGVRLIVFESVSVASGPKANLSGVKLGSQLQAIIERLCAETPGLDCRGYNPMTLKAFAIPEKGVPRNKEAMVAAAKRQWPEITIIDDNHADALWLLEMARREYLTPTKQGASR